MANPAEASARAIDEMTQRPDLDEIRQWLDVVQNLEWTPEMVATARKDILNLCDEVTRLRSMAGIVG